jgi:competence protein ComFC
VQERAGLIWNGLLDVIYPPVCLVCGARQAEPFCVACRAAIEPMTPPFCDRCGVPVVDGSLVCVSCASGSEPPFEWSQAMGRYLDTLRRAILRLKYHRKTALALPLGRLLARSLDTPLSPLLPVSLLPDKPAFDAVVPVPLHPSRLRERGFNQAELLAQVVARERGWRVDTDGLRRVRRTRSQTNLSPSERAANVQGAFVARSPLYFSHQSILLLDDVLTTTATLRECAKVVREAGATRVCIVALASGN